MGKSKNSYEIFFQTYYKKIPVIFYVSVLLTIIPLVNVFITLNIFYHLYNIPPLYGWDMADMVSNPKQSIFVTFIFQNEAQDLDLQDSHFVEQHMPYGPHA